MGQHGRPRVVDLRMELTSADPGTAGISPSRLDQGRLFPQPVTPSAATASSILIYGFTWYDYSSPSVKGTIMGTPAEFLVSTSGQMSVPAAVRHRWGLEHGGRVTVVDLGDAVILLPPGGRQKLLANALSAEDHRRFVASLDDPDLATT
jgi:hypothetical protein